MSSPRGSPEDTLREALHRLGDLGRITAVSSFLETEPVGLRNQPRFLNAAALLDTSLGPLDLMRSLLALETALGRVRSADAPPKGPRVIDLDLLLYEDGHGHSLILDDPDLVLPHPAMTQRRFVLQPLAEIASEMRVPTAGHTVAALLASLPASLSTALPAPCE